MMTINIICGDKIDNGLIMDEPRHPLLAAQYAIEIINRILALKIEKYNIFSNSSDFVTAVVYCCKINNIKINYYRNSVSKGNETTLDMIYKDWNRSLKFLDDLEKKAKGKKS